jgi:hypothetical protein
VVLGKNIILRILIEDPLKAKVYANPEDYLIMRIRPGYYPAPGGHLIDRH